MWRGVGSVHRRKSSARMVRVRRQADFSIGGRQVGTVAAVIPIILCPLGRRILFGLVDGNAWLGEAS